MDKQIFILFSIILLVNSFASIAQYTTKNVTGDWETPSNWSQVPGANTLNNGYLGDWSFVINGEITRNGSITQLVTATIKSNSVLYVTGEYLANGGSLTLEQDAMLYVYGNFTGAISVNLSKGSVLAIVGDYNSTGGTLEIQGSGQDEGTVIIGGDFYTTSQTNIRNNGNLIVGGNFYDPNGTTNILGNDNTDQIYFIGDNPTIDAPNGDICNDGSSQNCEYGNRADLENNESSDIIDLVNQVIGQTCSISAALTSTTNPTCPSSSDGAIDITVTGASSPVYSWNDGVASEDRSSIGEGTYSVTITEASCTTQLTGITLTASITGSVIITSQPSDVEVCELEAVVFTVVATGPGLIYQWKFEGGDIIGANSDAYSIGSASLSDNGTYAVLIEDQCGTQLLSSGAALSVNELPISGELYRDPNK